MLTTCLDFLSSAARAELAAFVDEIVARRTAELSPARSPWMTVEETAEYLRWPKKRVQNWTRAMPHRKVEGRVLFRRDELDAWLDDYYAGPRWRAAAEPRVGHGWSNHENGRAAR